MLIEFMTRMEGAKISDRKGDRQKSMTEKMSERRQRCLVCRLW